MSVGFVTKSIEITKQKEILQLEEEKATAKEAKRLKDEKAATREAKIETEWFQNCTELRKKYPNGVASTSPECAFRKEGWSDSHRRLNLNQPGSSSPL